jgi:urocanate hydratase
VLTTDPLMGVVRHYDAGYGEAVSFAERQGLRFPMPPGSVSSAGGGADS